MAINVTYDTISNVYCIEIADGDVARTVEFDETHLVDLTEAGGVLAVEVLDPSRARLQELAEAFGLMGALAEIEKVVAATIPTSPLGTFSARQSLDVAVPEVRYSVPLAQFQGGFDNGASVPSARPSELDLAAAE